jgi:hypothetical protein
MFLKQQQQGNEKEPKANQEIHLPPDTDIWRNL